MLETKKSDEFDGKMRTLIKFNCHCGNTTWVPMWHFKDRKYCTRECPIKTKSKLTCHNCKKEIFRSKSRIDNSKNGLFFCSRGCKEFSQSYYGGNVKAIQPPHYRSSELRYRRRAFDEYGKICQRCQYNKYSQMLDVHHKDGNRTNNQISNLEVLCVWCHALETRKNWKDEFGGLM